MNVYRTMNRSTTIKNVSLSKSVNSYDFSQVYNRSVDKKGCLMIGDSEWDRNVIFYIG